MDVRNCKKCNKIFNYVSGPIVCMSCREAMEDTFKTVKKYVSEHKGCTMQEVSEECDVEMSQIRQWLREERLEFAEGSQIQLGCEKCGALIRSGRFCDKCKNEMTRSFSNAMQRPAPAMPETKKNPKDNPKMRFL